MNNRYAPNRDRPEMVRRCLRGGWILLLVGILLGMTYLWLYSQVVQASTAVESHENQLAYLNGRSLTLRSRLETLKSPASIARMLEERQIALADPDPDRIVRVRREETPAAEEAFRAGSPRDLGILSIVR